MSASPQIVTKKASLRASLHEMRGQCNVHALHRSTVPWPHHWQSVWSSHSSGFRSRPGRPAPRAVSRGALCRAHRPRARGIRDKCCVSVCAVCADDTRRYLGYVSLSLFACPRLVKTVKEDDSNSAKTQRHSTRTLATSNTSRDRRPARDADVSRERGENIDSQIVRRLFNSNGHLFCIFINVLNMIIFVD